ncbi:MAG: hypothetical protein RLZZ296_427 [Pseudomonadota bacterium]|jgi:hypothetical protein
MSDTTTSGMALGLAALAAIFLWGARYEYIQGNQRDANLLAGVAIASLISGAAVFLI